MRTQALSLTALLLTGFISNGVYAAAQGTVEGTNVFITSGAITNNHMAVDSIRGGNVEDGTLRGNDFADDSIFSNQSGANAIGASELGNASVDTAALQEGAVSTSKLANNAVNTGKIADGGILGVDIAAGAVNGSHIANGSVGTAQLSSELQLDLQKFDGFEHAMDRGDAMAMAINAVPFVSGKRHSFGVGAAGVSGTEALGVGYRYYNQSNFSFGFGASFSEGESAVSGGAAWGF